MKDPKQVKLGHHVLYRCTSGESAYKDSILRGAGTTVKETVYRPATVLCVCPRGEWDDPKAPPRLNLRVLADNETYADAYRKGIKYHSTIGDDEFPAWIEMGAD